MQLTPENREGISILICLLFLIYLIKMKIYREKIGGAVVVFRGKCKLNKNFKKISKTIGVKNPGNLVEFKVI